MIKGIKQNKRHVRYLNLIFIDICFSVSDQQFYQEKDKVEDEMAGLDIVTSVKMLTGRQMNFINT